MCALPPAFVTILCLFLSSQSHINYHTKPTLLIMLIFFCCTWKAAPKPFNSNTIVFLPHSKQHSCAVMLGSDAFSCDSWSAAVLQCIAPSFPCSLAGVSRSVTLVVAYIMTITDFGWEDALSVVRAARSCANPNMGFQRQLQEFEKHDVDQVNELQKRPVTHNSKSDSGILLIILWSVWFMWLPVFALREWLCSPACFTKEILIDLKVSGNAGWEKGWSTASKYLLPVHLVVASCELRRSSSLHL